MKFLIALALALAIAAAFNLLGAECRSRIINGSNASLGQIPYQVGLSLKDEDKKSYWCGGSLIGKQWILTAAHCFDDIKSVTVYLGSVKRYKADVTHIVPISDVTVHHGWSAEEGKHDIALIKIPSVTLSNTIKIVPLPAIAHSQYTFDNQYAIASGWGKIKDTSTTSTKTLQWGRMKVVNNMECIRTFQSFDTVSQICSSTSEGVSVCLGDSGGPLVVESTGIQIGVTIFVTEDGCELGHPNAFTSVNYYLNWIKSITGISY